MRVITGKARGRRLKAPAAEGPRPTADHVKEAIFNILQFDLEGRRVLDLFAGTGQLGIEALSRGAKECVFVDSANAAATVIRQNIEICNFSDCGKVVVADVPRFVASQISKFDIVILDPPYNTQLLEKTLNAVFESDLLNKGGLMLAEYQGELPKAAEPYYLRKTYNHGTKKLALFGR